MGRAGRRLVTLLGAGAAVVVASGCGQTDFATGVGQTRAQLNGTITTVEAGEPERAWFQFWPAATPTAKQRTAGQPVTATGPISTTLSGLAPDTTYAFRLCGRQGTVKACAQTRTFTTSHDSVQAVGDSETVRQSGILAQVRDVDVDVRAGLPGNHATATLFLPEQSGGLRIPLGGPDITCLAVSGHVAQVQFRNASLGSPASEHGYATLLDGGPVGSGRDRVVAGLFPGDPSTCVVPSDLSVLQTLTYGDVSVNDVSATP
jgi:hypothetical protein